MFKVEGRNFLHRLHIAQANITTEEPRMKSPIPITHHYDSIGKLGRISPQTEAIFPPDKEIKRHAYSLRKVCQVNTCYK